MPSDTHTDEELDKAYAHFVAEQDRIINERIASQVRAAQLALIGRLRKHGHGGGNWRRLLDEEARKLEE